jgi:pullulanase
VKTARHDANGFYVPARTTAVFRRAAQKSCAPYPRDMFVRGSFNDWGNPTPTEQYKLQFLGGKAYAVSAPVTVGPQQFKIADAGWTADTNCGASADGVSARIGIPLTLACNNDSKNIGLSAPAAGNYTFSLDATSTANPVLTVTRSAPTSATVFVRGLFGDWGTTSPMTWDGESAYRAAINATATTAAEFKIATGDWAALNCGGATGGQQVTIGAPFSLACGDGTQNLGITFPSLGSYLFAIDATNQAALTLTVEPMPVSVFVRGLGGDWSDGVQNQLEYKGSNVYGMNKPVAAGATSFKIASSDWATVNCGGATADMQVTVGTPFALACGDGTQNMNIAPAVAGTYTFKFTRQSATAGQLLVTGP